MEEYTFIHEHSEETKRDLRGTAENKGIYDSHIGGKFPYKQKTQKDQYSGYTDDSFMPAVHEQVFLLFCRQIIHLCSTPSISD